MTLITPIAIIVYAANMPGFLRSGHISRNNLCYLPTVCIEYARNTLRLAFCSLVVFHPTGNSL